MIYQVLLIWFVAIGASISDTGFFYLFHLFGPPLEWVARWPQVYYVLVSNHIVAFAWLCSFVYIRRRWADLNGLGEVGAINRSDIHVFCLVNAPLLIFVFLRLLITVIGHCSLWFPYRVLLGCPTDVCGIAEFLVPSIFELAHVGLLSVVVCEVSDGLAVERRSGRWVVLAAGLVLYQFYGVLLAYRLAPVYWHAIGSAVVFIVWAMLWYSTSIRCRADVPVHEV